MKLSVRTVALLGIGIALYVVLSFSIKIPLISHIQTDLGYIAYGFFLFHLGPLAALVGVIGCLLESIIFSGLVPLGWMAGQLLIGIICGIFYNKVKNSIINVGVTILSVFIGIALIKTIIECTLYGIPFPVKFVKNTIAFVADTIPMIIGYFLAKELPIRITTKE